MVQKDDEDNVQSLCVSEEQCAPESAESDYTAIGGDELLVQGKRFASLVDASCTFEKPRFGLDEDCADDTINCDSLLTCVEGIVDVDNAENV